MKNEIWIVKWKTTEESHSEQQARAQLESVCEMVMALNIAQNSARDVEQDTANDDGIDAAREAIQGDALSVETRGDWRAAGDTGPVIPTEYKILLCTGGPAVRITGELNSHCEPETARLEHQDWGTPWQELRVNGEEMEALLDYARQFYFGE